MQWGCILPGKDDAERYDIDWGERRSGENPGKVEEDMRASVGIVTMSQELLRCLRVLVKLTSERW